jgi:hypothetical protein
MLLIECLVYIAVFVVVMGVAYSAFYRCLTDARNLRRNAEDIERILLAGERWRADIRAANRDAWLDSTNEQQVLHIPQPDGEITYRLTQNILWRQISGRTAESILTGIRQSKMILDTRARVAAWRWEVELKTRQKVVRLRPLFTFAAVSVGGENKSTLTAQGTSP